VCGLNIDDFNNIAALIVNEFPDIRYVSVMAMEMTGNAYVNKDEVWIPYRKAFNKIADAVMFLIKNGIDVKLYNFPLCTVEQKYWTLCEKSISPNKVRFADCCCECTYKGACGGVFAGTYLLEKDELEKIL
jgi:hypothetical protein